MKKKEEKYLESISDEINVLWLLVLFLDRLDEI